MDIVSTLPPFVVTLVQTFLTPLLDWLSARVYAGLIERGLIIC